MGSTTVQTDGTGVQLASTASTTNDLNALGPNALALDQQTHPGDQDYSILPTDRYVATDVALTGSWTWTLPLASSVSKGWQVTVADSFGTCNLTTFLTVPPKGTDTINAVASARVVTQPYGYMKVRSDAVSNWTIVDENPPHAATPGDANYQILPTDAYVITTTAFTASRTWVLPAASAVPSGWTVTIVDGGAAITSTNTLILDQSGTDTINGVATTWLFNYPYAYVVLRSDGTSNWTTVGQYPATPQGNRIPDLYADDLIVGATVNLHSAAIGIISSGRNDNVGYSAAFTQVGGPIAAFSISGVVPVVVPANLGQANGQCLILYNTTAYPMTLLHQNANSTATNRLQSPSGSDVVVGPLGSALLIYDATNLTRWIIQNVYDGTINTVIQDGWEADEATTGWVYGSATQFAMTGNTASTYLPKGTKISYNDGAVDYGHVASVSYLPASPNTGVVTTVATSLFTLIGHTLVNGYAVVPTGFVNTTGITNGSIKYVVGVTATTFQLSSTVGGSAITLGGTADTNVTITAASLVTLITNADYSIANATLTAPRYSYADNPQGFPTWFNWSPTLSGWSANPTNNVYQYRCDGTSIQLAIRQTTFGTSNNATHTATLPVTAATVTNMSWQNPCRATDNGTNQAGVLVVATAGVVVSLAGIIAAGNNTNAGNSCILGGQLTYQF